MPIIHLSNDTYFYPMHIVVNSIYLQGNHPHGNSFAHHLFGYLAGKHTAHHFYFLISSIDKNNYPKAENVTVINIKSSVKNIASLKVWNTIQLPKMLKQLKADLLIQPNGLHSATKVPQLLLITDLLWMKPSLFMPSSLRWYHKYFMKAAIAKASQIVALTEQTKQGLLSNFPVTSGKVSSIYSGASSIFHPLEYEERKQLKDSYSDGKEYFLYVGIHHSAKSIVELLKAFSLFKRWQKSNMKLLVAGKMATTKSGIVQKLDSYKYKDDVVLLPSISEQQLAHITAAAYIVIHPYYNEPFALPILSTMQCGVPVIAINDINIEEIGGDTCLYTVPDDNEALANQLKLLYRDENLSRTLVGKGMQTKNDFNWERTGGLFWEAVLKSVEG